MIFFCISYSASLGRPITRWFRRLRGANAFISTTEVDEDGNARFEVVSYSPEELAGHWETFKVVADLWRRRNNYDPRVK